MNFHSLLRFLCAKIDSTTEGDGAYNIYTFNAGLKRRLDDFAKKYRSICRLGTEDKKYRYVS